VTEPIIIIIIIRQRQTKS